MITSAGRAWPAGAALAMVQQVIGHCSGVQPARLGAQLPPTCIQLVQQSQLGSRLLRRGLTTSAAASSNSRQAASPLLTESVLRECFDIHNCNTSLRSATAAMAVRKGQQQGCEAGDHDGESTRGYWSRMACGGAAILVGGAVCSLKVEEVPYSGRPQVRPPQSIVRYTNEWGLDAFSQEKEGARKAGILLPDSSPYVQLVRKIGHRIVAVAEDGLGVSDWRKQGMEWEFIVVDSPFLQAHAYAGGGIVISKAMLYFCASDHELACILAHEVAHVLAQHHAEIHIVSGRATTALQRLFLWMIELEADIMALRLMAKACYSPAHALSVRMRFWDLHNFIHSSKTETWKDWLDLESSHPHPGIRAYVMEILQPAAYEILQNNRRHPQMTEEFWQAISAAWLKHWQVGSSPPSG